jgi:hypothetical protein
MASMEERNVSGPFPDPPIQDLDADGLMVPPWIKYPNIGEGSIGWRMGIGEHYKDTLYPVWWSRQPRPVRLRVRKQYPEPNWWSGYYKSLA